MKWMLDIPLQSPGTLIRYPEKIMVIGSCFTEHIGGRMKQLKFPVMQNPHGILFDPRSVGNSLHSYVEGRTYQAADLFFLDELWQSWAHHSSFSGTDQGAVLTKINDTQVAAHTFLKDAQWLIITLGSSFIYRLESGIAVANCHRAPGQWFNKQMMEVSDIADSLKHALSAVRQFNPGINVVFTISPVRHIRDGVVENNRSKARLIEATHQLVQSFDRTYYFPAYEWVIDVLRDYRFFDIDLVHPNFAATQFVFEKFSEQFISPEAAPVMKEIQQVITAFNHRSYHPETQAHHRFLEKQLEKIAALSQQYPWLELAEEKRYFENARNAQ